MCARVWSFCQGQHNNCDAMYNNIKVRRRFFALKYVRKTVKRSIMADVAPLSPARKRFQLSSARTPKQDCVECLACRWCPFYGFDWAPLQCAYQMKWINGEKNTYCVQLTRHGNFCSKSTFRLTSSLRGEDSWSTTFSQRFTSLQGSQPKKNSKKGK